MIKKLFLVLLISGCASNIGTTAPYKWTLHPDRIECPDDYVAYCEGRTRNQMECTCIEQREIQYLFEGLYR
jgi:hypothetical protein